MTHSYLATEKDWNRAIEANTLGELRSAIEPWRPFVPDALAVVEAMDDTTFTEWRSGLTLERQGKWAGEEHSRRFGALLIPASLLEASLVAQTYHVPLGAALMRLAEAKADGRDP